jgi:hypothetical protein
VGQQKLPLNNFARIILMVFIMFCLVIRTAYQGTQFDMLTSDMRFPPIKTIQQLFDQNFTFVVYHPEFFGNDILQRFIGEEKRLKK